ncbi:MAG: SRPBCC family protein [Alphaproteobacteria bacterium]
MSHVKTLAPVRKQVVVNVLRKRAFDIFTKGMTRWWPSGTSHTILKAPFKEAIIEPRIGGRWYHRAVDGSECDIGRVLVWEPPARIVLSWQLNGFFQYDPSAETEVEVRFAEEAPDRTRVELEHRFFERYAASGEALRAGVDSPNGWPALLELYAKSAESQIGHAQPGTAVLA